MDIDYRPYTWESKIKAKEIAKQIGLPLVPGSKGVVKNIEIAKKEITSCKEKLNESENILKASLVPKDPLDEKNVQFLKDKLIDMTSRSTFDKYLTIGQSERIASLFNEGKLPVAYTTQYEIATMGDVEFDKVKPKGKNGAVELVLRYEDISVDDADEGTVAANEVDIDRTVIGLNWYVTKTVKFMANYSAVSLDNEVNPGGTTEDLDSFQIRAQYAF